MKGLYEVYTTDHRATGIATEASTQEEAIELLNPNDEEYVHLVKQTTEPHFEEVGPCPYCTGVMLRAVPFNESSGYATCFNCGGN